MPVHPPRSRFATARPRRPALPFLGAAGRLAAVALLVLAAPSALAVDLDRDGLEDALEDALIERFAPELRFHPDEQHFLASVEWYLDRVELWFRGACFDRWVLNQPLGTRLVSQEQDEGLIDYPPDGGVVCIHPTSGGRRHRSGYSLDSDGRPRQSGFFLRIPQGNDALVQPGDLESARIYAHVRPSPDHHPGRIDVTYWLFYAYNPDVCGSIGNHEGDWERVTVRVDLADDGTPSLHAMAFAAHGAPTWKPASEVALNGSGRPIVYVAEGSHASYADRGSQHREYACDDQTAWAPDDGDGVWEPGESRRFDSAGRIVRTGEWGYERLPFLAYSGFWGSHFPDYGQLGDWTGLNDIQSPNTPFYKGRWTEEDPEPAGDDPDAHPWVFTRAGPGGSVTGLGYWDDPMRGVHDALLAYLVQDRCRPIPFAGTSRCGIELMMGPGTYSDFAGGGSAPATLSGPAVLRAIDGVVEIGR